MWSARNRQWLWTLPRLLCVQLLEGKAHWWPWVYSATPGWSLPPPEIRSNKLTVKLHQPNCTIYHPSSILTFLCKRPTMSCNHWWLELTLQKAWHLPANHPTICSVFSHAMIIKINPSQTSPSVLVWCSDRNPSILEMHVLTSCLELPAVHVLNTFENLWHMATLYHNTLSHWPIDHAELLSEYCKYNTHTGSVKAKERMLIYISRSKYCMQESTLRIFYIILISDLTLQLRSTMNWLYFYWRVHN